MIERLKVEGRCEKRKQCQTGIRKYGKVGTIERLKVR